jgi:HAD superfamily hydrolase (TIGR01509 family)
VIRAVIFDCFGVVISDALSVLTAELADKDPAAAAQVHALLAQSNTGLLSSEESSTQIAGIFGLSYEQYRARIQEGEIKNQQLLDYVTELRRTYKTALLSNIPQYSLSRRFTEDELGRYFDVVVASGEIGYAKPQAQAYEITADRLSVRLDECVFIDDREPYCEGARAVGMQAILYQDLDQFRTELEQLLADAKE